jgi:cell division protein ZapA
MPEIQITVNGRGYRVACGPGEEERLRMLAADVDRRIAGLVRSFGQVGESQLLLVSALLMADELDEMRNRNNDHPPGPNDGEAAKALDGVAERIEALAARLEAP